MLLTGLGILGLVLRFQDSWRLNTTQVWLGCLCGSIPLLCALAGLGFWINSYYRFRDTEAWIAGEGKMVNRLVAMQVPAFMDTLVFARMIGVAFTLVALVAWGLYAAAKMETGGVVFISIIGLFSIPLAIGSTLVLNRKPAGLGLLKFGSLLLVVRPGVLIRIWQLESDPDFREFLFGQHR